MDVVGFLVARGMIAFYAISRSLSGASCSLLGTSPPKGYNALTP